MPAEHISALTSSHSSSDRSQTEARKLLDGASYCYMFPKLQESPEYTLYGGAEKTHKTLVGLSHMMGLNRATKKPLELPPVYTYFGQFVSHDMTAPVPKEDGQFLGLASGIIAAVVDSADIDNTVQPKTADVLDRLQNQHKAPLTLYSLYGSGPFGNLDIITSFFEPGSAKFRIADAFPIDPSHPPESVALSVIDPSKLKPTEKAKDIPRNATGEHVALIVDRRNDDNLIISQLHLAMMLFHNRAHDELCKRKDFSTLSVQEQFEATRKLVTLHYQSCVVRDFLATLLHSESLDAALSNKKPLFLEYKVPLEFSVAALRFGHSMVSEFYDFNENFGTGSDNQPFASLGQLFMFTSRKMMGDDSGNTRQLPNHWVPDWKRLTRVRAAGRMAAEPIDAKITISMLDGLGHINNLEHESIAYRNLLRGFHRRIPFGQHLAVECGIEPLSAEKLKELIPVLENESYERDEVLRKTPAWLYFLCEAEALDSGKTVGPVASRIIAETIVGILRQTPNSILSGKSEWKPEDSELHLSDGRPIATIRDMLEFAGLLA